MRHLFYSVTFFLFIAPMMVFAQADATSLIQIPVSDSDGFGGYINVLYLLAISIAAILAVIKLIIAGVKYMLTDIVTSKGDAKSEMKGALLGLLLIIAAVVILNTINNDITQNEVLIERLDPPPASGIPAGGIQPAAGSRGAANNAAAAVNQTVSGGCDTTHRQTSEDDNYTYYSLDLSNCPAGTNLATRLGAFSRWCIDQNGGFDTNSTTDTSTCSVPKPGTVNTSLGTVTQTGGTVTSAPLTGLDVIGQIARLRNDCEDKEGRATTSNGPNGTAQGATVTCVTPTIIAYSGSTRNRNAWKGDCRANGGTFDENTFTPDYCFIWPQT